LKEQHSISLTMTAENISQKFEKRYEFSNCRFRFCETMLVAIKFKVMQYMSVNNESKQLKRNY
jgi:hypothetical protein